MRVVSLLSLLAIPPTTPVPLPSSNKPQTIFATVNKRNIFTGTEIRW